MKNKYILDLNQLYLTRFAKKIKTAKMDCPNKLCGFLSGESEGGVRG